MKYIDKDALVAEIERIMNEQQEICKADVAHGKKYPDDKNVEVIYQFQRLIKFLDTFEVKEVDLEKEIYDAEKRFGDIDEMGGYRILIFDDEFRDVLRHFFELGLKAQKGE